MKYQLLKTNAQGQLELFNAEEKLYCEKDVMMKRAKYIGLVNRGTVDDDDLEVYLVFNSETEFLQNEYRLEMQELTMWFRKYDNQVSQYNRAIRQGKTFDKDMTELDAQADVAAKRIVKLRMLIK